MGKRNLYLGPKKKQQVEFPVHLEVAIAKLNQSSIPRDETRDPLSSTCLYYYVHGSIALNSSRKHMHNNFHTRCLVK